jgi:hypothetical protein
LPEDPAVGWSEGLAACSNQKGTKSLLDHLDLNPALLEAERPADDMPSEFAACLNALGSYCTERFVLRLSPRVHRLVDEAPKGIYSTDTLNAETIQAYTTVDVLALRQP